MGSPLASSVPLTVLTEQTLGLSGVALPLQRKTRPPDAGSTAFFIDFIAAVTDAGVTAPCRSCVPTPIAATVWNTVSPGRSSGGTLALLTYLLRIAAYCC